MPDLPGGVATGIGSLPGTDVRAAIAEVFAAFADFPHLPELPGRGPGADMIGRTATLLVDLPVELYAARWQLTSRRGRDLRVAADFLERDLDVLTENESDHDGPLKISVAGPWTLATSLNRPIGGPMLRDFGAVRELAASAAEGIAAHVADVSARLPRAEIVLQLDEPSLPSVLAGTVPTESGLSRYRPVASDVARDTLAMIVDAVGVPVVVHCCAPNVPVGLLHGAGAAAVSMDLTLFDIADTAAMDEFGAAIEAGLRLYAGVVPALGESTSDDKVAAARVTDLWRALGFDAGSLRQVVATPTCGLAGASPQRAADVMRVAREAAKRMTDEV
ncbi:methionine synthase [Stackebrandtia soli]|uniref:methionine synthase n=1 Tax=Stackebrandtia soli TaxID=1892856 RepID=UPI0039EB9625